MNPSEQAKAVELLNRWKQWFDRVAAKYAEDVQVRAAIHLDAETCTFLQLAGPPPPMGWTSRGAIPLEAPKLEPIGNLGSIVARVEAPSPVCTVCKRPTSGATSPAGAPWCGTCPQWWFS